MTDDELESTVKCPPVVRRSTILRTDPGLLRAPSHPNATNRGVVTIDENIHVGPGVIVADSLVLEDTMLEPEAVVTDWIVSTDATIESAAIVDNRSETGRQLHR